MMKTIIYLIIFLLTLSLGTAVSVENADFKIESSKDTYYCQNIINSDGCLIKADVSITKKTEGDKSVLFENILLVMKVVESTDCNKNSGIFCEELVIGSF